MRRWLAVHGDTVAVAITALLIRGIYNLFVHPPLAFRNSDMGGYIGRAERLFDAIGTADPQLAFYPYGTHALLGTVMAVFGRDARASIGLFYAVLGAVTAMCAHLTARRLMPRPRRLTRALAVLFVVHVPWITLGGYLLSETPFACALTITCHYSLRFFDHGRPRDAAIAGTAFALACAIRPQALLALPLMVIHLLRRRTPRLGWRAVGAFVAPLVVVLSLSAVRLRHHTGRLGLVSTNAGFNLAFARCHCWALSASRTPNSRFEIPAFKSLRDHYRDLGFRPVFELSPILGGSLLFDGELWDPTPATALARRCVEASGPWLQAKYSATHVIMLWGYNIPWPTSGGVVAAWQTLQAIWIPGLVIVLFAPKGSRRVRGRRGMLTAHVWAMLATAIVFFGEARMRVPYDGIIATLSMIASGQWLDWLLRGKRASRRPSTQASL
jgi:hypothetical protein